MLRSVNHGFDVSAAIERLPLGPLRDPLLAAGAHLVGGAVRDLLARGEAGTDLDVAIEGDPEELLDDLDPASGVVVEARHARFGSVRVTVAGASVDLTRTRSETYPAPGALPIVVAATIERDLERRDFTINAMAIPLGGEGRLLDPFDGRADLRSRTLRVLHDASFNDDPTRAIRAARYGSRLGLQPDHRTLELLVATDLGSVSDDRRRAELGRLADEAFAPAGFALLAGWGLIELSAEALALIAGIDRLASGDPWSGRSEVRSAAIMLAAEGGEPADAAARLATAVPDRPSEAVRLARAHPAEVLLLASAAGGAWITECLSEWAETALEIDGGDLIAAGIPEGPAVGAGLRGALERKLDGGLVGGREAELELALELARAEI